MIDIEKSFKDIEGKIKTLPCKLNFKIGETAQFLSLSPYVLRYWEKELPLLKPTKFYNNQRLFSKKDIKILLLIKTLLYRESFSMEGLRKHLPSYVKQMNSFQEKKSFSPPLQVEKYIQQSLSIISCMREHLEAHKF
ncbi:MAG: MerR family transcriptional regulator [Bdellovibrionales bacterium]|nr:MerR family transcriptional regulator [Bdellovibrionales bacterium]